MKHRVQQLIASICFWMLRKCGCRVPVIRQVTITPRDMQRVRAQEIVTYHLLNQTRPGVANVARHQVRESLLKKIGELVEVREEVTPDGIKFSCDMLVVNYPKYD